MSKLKVYIKPIRKSIIGNTTIRQSYYLKSEADKVIAEKDKEIARLDDLAHAHNIELLRKENLIAELKAQKAQAEDDCAYWKTMAQKNATDNSAMAKQRAEAFKKESHQKYKRCLANAWGCQQRMEFFHELVLEEARMIALPNKKVLQKYRSKRERAAKWRKLWLALAEKFKPNSTAQQG